MGVDAKATVAEARSIRGDRPTLACQCKSPDGPIGIDAIVEAIETEALLRDLTPTEAAQ